MSAAMALPPALFGLVDLPPWEDPIARHNLIPALSELRPHYCCALLYGAIGRGWVNHVCAGRPGHDGAHSCDRCEVTW